MDTVEKYQMLKSIYAGALADAVLRLGREGVLERVTRQKRTEQLAGGKIRAAQFGIASPQEVFTKLAELMGCADWTIETNGEDGFTATASRCMLCALTKKLGTQSPCRIYCLDPMEGMVKGLDQDANFDIKATLFDDTQCRVVITRKTDQAGQIML